MSKVAFLITEARKKKRSVGSETLPTSIKDKGAHWLRERAALPAKNEWFDSVALLVKLVLCTEGAIHINYVSCLPFS